MLQKKLSYRLEYIGLRVLEYIIALLPRSVALFLGSMGGELLYLTGTYRHVVERNFQHVAIWTKSEYTPIIRQLYRNIGRYAVDFLSPSQSKIQFSIDGSDLIEQSKKVGKGTLAILAHFGNWELLGALFGKTVDGINVVVKEMKNPHSEKWLAHKREQTNVTTIFPRHALRKLYQVIQKNQVAGLLIDQHAGKHGTMVPFLGKDANTVRTVAGIALKTGCTIIAAYALMNPDGSYNVVLKNADSPVTPDMKESDAIFALQKQHNEIVSNWIIKNPDHWFGWFHHRYRGTIGYSRL